MTAVTFSILHADCSETPAFFELFVNDVLVDVVPTTEGCDCPSDPLEVVFTTPAVLGLIDPASCSTFRVEPSNGAVRLGFVQVVLTTAGGTVETCAFDGTFGEPTPRCVARALCDPPGFSENVPSVTGAINCPLCGNGEIDSGEACDDGNIRNGDGCSAGCAIEDIDRDGVIDRDDVCAHTIIPEGVPTRELGVNRFALMTGSISMDGAIIFDTVRSPGSGPQGSFTTRDTRGCSCEQITEVLQLGEGHLKFGCSSGAMERWIKRFE